MDAAICKDIEHVNSTLLALVSDRVQGERRLRSLGASVPVVQRILRASPRGISVAERCEVPLIAFTGSVEEALGRKPASQPSASPSAGDPALEALARLVLPIAYRIVRLYPDLGQTYFGLTRLGTGRLMELPQVEINELGARGGMFLELRVGTDALFWDRILIGDRLEGARARWISTNVAFLSVGLAQ
jgi:hypothetical protein